MLTRRSVLSGFLVAVCASPAPGQGLAPATCRSVVANLLSNPFRSDTLILLGGCPAQRGTTLATLMGNTEMARSHPRLYHEIGQTAAVWREPELFERSLAVAGDPKAPTLARLWAIKLLIGMETHSGTHMSPWDYQAYTWKPGICSVDLPVHQRIFDGYHPLPVNHKTRTIALVTRINAEEPAPPGGVLYFASCLKAHVDPILRMDLAEPAEEPRTFDAETDIELVAVCGGVHRLRNYSRVSVAVQLFYRMFTNSPTNRLTLEPGGNGRSYSEVTVHPPLGFGPAIIVQINSTGGPYWKTQTSPPAC